MSDNPSAFPHDAVPGWWDHETGMTLRDWFAGQAISGSDFMNCTGWTHLDLAQYAYSIADAMLKARSENPQ